MSGVLAIVPARAGSKSIPRKNFRPLAGVTPLERAVTCARAVADRVVVSTDAPYLGAELLRRPPELAQDDTPMIDVVQHVLAEIPGPEDEIVLLVQCTQPLREPKHLQAAIQLLRETQADSVVSVVELPRAHSPDLACQIVTFPSGDVKLRPWPYQTDDGTSMRPWSDRPTRRQDAEPAFIPDGTVYAFYRRNLTYGHFYGPGDRVRPLIIPPEETCALDTPADWAEAERRLRALGR